MLQTWPKTLDDLKKILLTIGNVREQHLVAERNLSEADEMLYTLRVYNVLVQSNLPQPNCFYISLFLRLCRLIFAGYIQELQEEELQTCASAQHAWNALVEKSKTLDLRLFRVKAKFKRVTDKDALQFLER
jgi:hypothetical protein